MERKVPPCERGSIPAHAGEPSGITLLSGIMGVYPRPRGGTDARGVEAVVSEGLSPPTRGNPLTALLRAVGAGSIPAHAGEPSRRAYGAVIRAVYPRPRGGTPVGLP